MSTQAHFAAPRPVQTIAAAFVAIVVSLSILGAVGTLFQSRGAPLEKLAAAERACAQHTYQSERQACMTQWLAESQPRTIARR